MQSISAAPHRLLFLTVNCSFSHSSLALPLLHSACKDLPNWEWLRCDTTNGGDIMSTVSAIYACQPDVLAVDLYLFNRQCALEILERYHALNPRCRIVAGGPECLGSGAEDLLKSYPWLDCVFRGEGENIFRQYLEEFDSSGIPAGRILPAEGNAYAEKWSVSDYPVNDPFFTADKPFVQIETSRGCPMKCFYCTSGNTNLRYRSLEQVQEELSILSAKGVKEVRVLDRTFNLPQTRGAALLRIFREKFPHMRFHLELHPQFLDEQLQEELKNALPDQLHIEAGIQCLNSKVQELIGRNSNTEKVLSGLAFLAGQSAFETHADLIAGLPGQQWNDILSDTVQLMTLEIAEIQLEVLKVLPGTPLREIAAEHAISYSPVAPYDVMQSNTMSLLDIQHARDLSRLLDITYNNSYLHTPALSMLRECPDFVKKLLEFFHHTGGSCNTVWDLKKRFLFMFDFCRTYNLQQSQAVLAYQWLIAGFLPGQGPDEYSCKIENIPENTTLIAGNESCRGERESRYWSFKLNGTVYYLAYNRKYALNRPAAIWKMAL